MVKTGLEDALLDGDVLGLDAAGVAFADHQARLRNEALELSRVPRGDDLLLVARSFGEHAQIEQRTGPAIEIHGDERVVEDVRGAAVIAFLDVVHVLTG